MVPHARGERPTYVHFHCARGFDTPVLAGMLDSLVRVSRRGEENHFVNARPDNDVTRRYSRSGETLPPDAHHPAIQAGDGHDPNTSHVPVGTRSSDRVRHWFPSLPFQRFQVLFNSLFKVLCIFPSRYLFAIGLPPVFSFRWDLPPALSCNPKQLDSSKTGRTRALLRDTNGIVTLLDALFQETSSRCGKLASPLLTTIRDPRVQIYIVSSSRFTRRYWGNPG